MTTLKPVAVAIVQPHSRGVAGVLADAGLRDRVRVHRSGQAVNVHLPERQSPAAEGRQLARIVRLLDEAGYEAHRSTVVPWLVRVTGKRKPVRSSS